MYPDTMPEAAGVWMERKGASVITTHRPRYHFLPPQNWMNDPNGLIHWQGQYHLFYQHNPEAAYWGNMHWGHAVSPDLVHWKHLPIAIAPSPDGADVDGVFSGCSLGVKGAPVFFYTGVFPEVQCMAVGSHDLLRIEKYVNNPIIAEPPQNLELAGFRDPYVWFEDNHWWMLVGSGIEDYGGAVLLYRSSNLTQWDYVGIAFKRAQSDIEPLYTASMWECPNLVSFNNSNKRLLLVSACDFLQPKYTVAMLGKYINRQFVPEQLFKFDCGDNLFYAPQVFIDETGRRIVIGWISEDRPQSYAEQVGWAGLASLPRELLLTETNQLMVAPINEIESLRAQKYFSTVRCIGNESTAVFDQALTGSVELNLQISTDVPVDLTFTFCFGSTDTECLTLRVNTANNEIQVDTTKASVEGDIPGSIKRCPIHMRDDGRILLRMFLDRSVLEMFVNDLSCLTTRYYPQDPEITRISVMENTGKSCDISTTCYILAPIW